MLQYMKKIYALLLKFIVSVIENIRFVLFQRSSFKAFNEKTVAVVGSSPALLEKHLGPDIDNHDVVVRINLQPTSGKEYFLGARTDYRFIGATMLDEHVHSFDLIKKEKAIIITSTKNRLFFQKSGVQVIYFPKNMPRKAFGFFSTIIPELKTQLVDGKKPPRSGLVFIMLMLAYSKTKKVNLYGFTRTNHDALRSIHHRQGDIVEQDRTSFFRNHCDPEKEIAILEELNSFKLVSFGYD